MSWQNLKSKELLVASWIIAGSFIVAITIFLVHGGFVSSVAQKIEYKFRNTPDKWALPTSERTPNTNKNTQEALQNKIAFIDAEPPEYLMYVTTTNSPHGIQQYDLYIGEDTQNHLRLLHYKMQNYEATTTYPVYRIYPGNVSTEQIIADYKSETGPDDLPHWFNNQPEQIDNFENGLLTENLVKNDNGRPALPSWLAVPGECFTYRPRDNCRFEITAQNPFNLPAVTLTKETGPYSWSDSITPYAIYVTNDKKVLIRWSFSDAGAVSKVNSLWDPVANTHVQVSDVSGFYGESFSLNLPQVEKTYVISHNQSSASTSPILKQNPFLGWAIYGEPLLEGCYDISFHPSDLADDAAPWLLEYKYGCYFGYDPTKTTLQGLSAWYELDPTTDTVRALTGVMPK